MKLFMYRHENDICNFFQFSYFLAIAAILTIYSASVSFMLVFSWSGKNIDSVLERELTIFNHNDFLMDHTILLL